MKASPPYKNLSKRAVKFFGSEEKLKEFLALVAVKANDTSAAHALGYDMFEYTRFVKKELGLRNLINEAYTYARELAESCLYESGTIGVLAADGSRKRSESALKTFLEANTFKYAKKVVPEAIPNIEINTFSEETAK